MEETVVYTVVVRRTYYVEVPKYPHGPEPADGIEKACKLVSAAEHGVPNGIHPGGTKIISVVQGDDRE